jgi:membrane associated rhomboid family serine protease
MIPLKDRVIRRRFPFVNLALIAINIAVFLYEWTLPDPQLHALFLEWGFVPQRFFEAQGWDVARVTPLLTAMFLHGGWFHLGSNMLSLWIFGDNVEDRMGHVIYLLFYLVSGAVASLAHGIIDVASPIPVVGASGAIAGVLGAYLLLFPRARVVTIIPIFFFITIHEVSAVLFIGFWFVSQLFYGVAALTPMTAETGIAWWAHIGGFVVGLLLAIPLGGRSRPYLPEQQRR